MKQLFTHNDFFNIADETQLLKAKLKKEKNLKEAYKLEQKLIRFIAFERFVVSNLETILHEYLAQKTEEKKRAWLSRIISARAGARQYLPVLSPIPTFKVAGMAFTFLVLAVMARAESSINTPMDSTIQPDTLRPKVVLQDSSDVLFSKVDSLLNHENYSEAEKLLLDARKNQPKNIEIIKKLIECYELNKKQKDALPLYDEILKIDPFFPEIGWWYFSKGRAYFVLKDYENARKCFDSALKYEYHLDSFQRQMLHYYLNQLKK